MFIHWGQTPQISKRWFTSDSSGMGGARWAFFVIFIVFVVIMIVGTLRVNRSRSRQGRLPIYGTRWMTPPSYFQSQNQYNQPTQRDADMPNAYVPQYTATANDNDYGYYDRNGTFHQNPNVKEPQMPEPLHHRTTSNADGVALADYNRTGDSGFNTVHDDADLMFRRPSGPPPAANTTGDGEVYERPSGPPPSATTDTGDASNAGATSSGEGTTSGQYQRPNGPPPAS